MIAEFSSYALCLEGYSIEEIEALEGYNLDTKRNIKMMNPELKEVLAVLKEANYAYREGQRARKREKDLAKARKLYREAIDHYQKARNICVGLKGKADTLAEPSNLGERLLSHFTPLWMFGFPREETNGAYMAGNTMVIMTTTYTDRMSMDTKSGVKRSFQERMNLQLKKIDDAVALCNKMIKKCSSGGVKAFL